MNANQLRDFTWLAIQFWTEIEGKALYLQDGNDRIPCWPYNNSNPNRVMGFWWVSRSKDHSTGGGKPTSFMKHASNQVSIYGGQVISTTTMFLLGVVGVPVLGPAGDLIGTAVDAAVDGRSVGEALADPLKAGMDRDMRRKAKGTDNWQRVAYETDFLVGGMSASSPIGLAGDRQLSLRIFPTKADYERVLKRTVVRAQEDLYGAVKRARSETFDGSAWNRHFHLDANSTFAGVNAPTTAWVNATHAGW